MSRDWRRITAIWLVLVVLGGWIVYVEWSGKEASPPASKALFSFRESDLAAVELHYEGRLATFLRSPGGLWFQHDASHRHAPPETTSAGTVVAETSAPHAHAEPDPALADQIARTIDFVARIVADRRIQPKLSLREYGLENPPILLLFFARTPHGSAAPQPLAALAVGSTLPTGLSYYAQENGARDMAIIPLYQVNGLIKLAFGIDLTPPLPERPAAPQN
jgi:hypothetical protein